jgi:PAS domain S-box-containing protein
MSTLADTVRNAARGLRILLAGCDWKEERELREILTEACIGPEIDATHERESLSARLASRLPDLLIVCEQGAGVSVAEVLTLAADRAPGMPVIVCTKTSNEAAATRALEGGASDYVRLDSRWEVSVAVRRGLRECEQRQRRREAEERLRKHINLLQLQQVVATAANEARSPEDAAQSVLDIARAYGQFTLGHLIYGPDDNASLLRASSIWSGYDEQRHKGFRERTEQVEFAQNGSVAATVLQEGKLAWVPDISKEPRFVRAAAAAAAGLRSVVMAPVAAAAETLGVIEFFSAAPHPRDEHMALVLEYVATQLGRVFERDRAERRLETRAREQMVLAELSRKAVEVVNLDDFLLAAAHRVEDVLPGCHCAVLEVTANGSALRVRTSTQPMRGSREYLIPAGTEEDIGYAVLRGDTLKVDMTALPWKVPRFLRPEVASAITASIRLRNDVFGALAIYSKVRRDFSRNESTFARSVANVLATAAEHSTAFHQLKLLGSAVTQSQDSIIITDAQIDAPGPRILFVNPAFTTITGYRMDEVIGLTPRILHGEKTDADFLQNMNARLREGKSAHGVTINYRKNGTEFWVEMQVSPLRDSEGNVTHFVGIQRDVTERKIAEQRIQESEEMLGAAQRMAHMGSWVIDFQPPSNGKLVWSDEVFRIFGLAPGGIEVTVENFYRAVHPDDREIVDQTFQAALRDREEFHIDHRIILPDGTQRIVHEQATATYDADGKIIKVIGTVQDITERKQAEEEVRHWKERYEMLTKASGQIIFDWDYSTSRIAFGGDCERVLGYPPERLGHTLEDWVAMVHPDDRKDFIREMDKQAAKKGKAELEYRIRRSDQTYITVRDIGYPMLDENGEITRVLGSVTDISSEKALEVQLRRSQKMEAFGKLAGGVAHDFNNLLTVITGYNEVVLSELPANDPKREYIEEIARAANRASALTSQLLAFSRQQKMQPRVVNLNEVIKDTSKMLARLIGEHIDMRLNPADDLGNAKADVGQMEQVLMNLAVNARDAMPGGGAITVSTRNAVIETGKANTNLEPGEYILLEVADTGIGMSPEVQAKIFEPFFTTKAPGEGTGLGLATCYGIIKQSGGEIVVQSRLGAGTTFQIYLPRVYEALKSYDIPLGPGELPTGSETILVVEDELPVRVIVRSVLQKLKYTVLEAANGAEAMRILLTPGGNRVDLLLTDVVMPEMGGKELARRTRTAFPEMPIILTSGYPMALNEELMPGATFLQKPFSPKALAEAIRESLDAGCYAPGASEK